MSSAAAPSIFGSAPAFRRGSDSSDTAPAVGAVSRTSLGPGGVGKQREALKLRLDLNLEVEIAIKAKVNGDITLSLFRKDNRRDISLTIVKDVHHKMVDRHEYIEMPGGLYGAAGGFINRRGSLFAW
ncbi:uncharacterized protein EV420DRAFT_1483102 [Desarmillaria tabescens]|uniref:Uncharacterized protein n=1 Tax=Armillaria tabescens TaxID=1929756 RepID=A0AA39MX80_ARMTA|nr:uncharacterized protein EV420DRAFT_1483102 [Desarmillaria tabescens]KAK0449568.1 hypothetical protein EV420DRAFT_1483102 [Desarmillaria tabescens]